MGRFAAVGGALGAYLYFAADPAEEPSAVSLPAATAGLLVGSVILFLISLSLIVQRSPRGNAIVRVVRFSYYVCALLFALGAIALYRAALLEQISLSLVLVGVTTLSVTVDQGSQRTRGEERGRAEFAALLGSVASSAVLASVVLFAGSILDFDHFSENVVLSAALALSVLSIPACAAYWFQYAVNSRRAPHRATVRS